MSDSSQSEPEWPLLKVSADAKMWEDVANEYLDDLRDLGAAFVSLYLTALNGVVCDPSEQLGPRTLCSSCNEAWKKGQAVLDKHDGAWGNMYRNGPSFQPGAPGPKKPA